LLVNYDTRRKFGRSRRIAIWWGGLQGNGGMMLLVAYLMMAHHRWRDAQVTVRTVVDTEEQRGRAFMGIQAVLESARVEGTPVVSLREGREIAEIMHEQSADADIAILGVRLPHPGEDVEVFFDRMNAILEGMPTTILVHSSRDFEGEPVLFDEAATREPDP